MIIENAGVKGLVSDLAYLDEVTTKLGFVRWQWEYTRATYDYKIELEPGKDVFFLRVNARATKGKLESPYAALVLEEAYIGKATYPHGLDYDEALIPANIRQISERKLAELRKELGEPTTVGEVKVK